MDDRQTASLSSTQDINSVPTVIAAAPPLLSHGSAEDDDLKLQIMILDQQNKKRPGYIPAMTDPSNYPGHVHGNIGNLFDGGDSGLLCDDCVHNMYKTDGSLWPDLKRSIHLSLPVELRTGPDMHQCFCGYFCFRTNDLERHLETAAAAKSGSSQQESEILASLTCRIEAVDMHEDCRQKLVALINQTEHND